MKNYKGFAGDADPVGYRYDKNRLNQSYETSHACHSGILVRFSGNAQWMH
ncbi:hypothetical protein [Methylotuvimicrobium sp. KM2]